MSKSVFITKELLLSTQDELAIEKVELKNAKGEVRGHVFVREMMSKAKDTWEASMRKEMPAIGGARGAQPELKMNLVDYRVKLAICTLCDEKGVLLFSMDKPTIKALGEKISASNMEAIADAANKLNVITPEGQENVVKN